MGKLFITMKKKIFLLALIASASIGTWSQSPIVSFPISIGQAKYSRYASVPKELKDASNMKYLCEVDGNIIAQYSGAYGLLGGCSFDESMNVYFPPKDWLGVKSRFIGVNDNKQILAIRVAKKGAVVGLLDNKMQLQKSVPICADAYFDKSVADMYVEGDKAYLIIWQFDKNPSCWMGYVLDAKTLDVLSQTELGTSWYSEFTYSENKSYMACVAGDENKGKVDHDPLYTGANIKLYDKNFTLIQERYVYGSIDAPWVQALSPKERKKYCGGGLSAILTKGEGHVLVDDNGECRYITLDAVSVRKVTASSNTTFLIRDNKLSIYTLSSTKNDSVSIDDIYAGESIYGFTIKSIKGDSVRLVLFCKGEQFAPSGRGLVEWDVKNNEFSMTPLPQLEFINNDPKNFQRILCKLKNDWLIENRRLSDKGFVSFELWRRSESDSSVFPFIASPLVKGDKDLENYVKHVLPKQNRFLLAYSKATDVFCFLVFESLNDGLYSTPAIEPTTPLYIDFVNNDGKLTDFVFPHATYDMVNGKRAYRSQISMDAFQYADDAIFFYLRCGDGHQWVILYPSLFVKN